MWFVSLSLWAPGTDQLAEVREAIRLWRIICSSWSPQSGVKCIFKCVCDPVSCSLDRAITAQLYHSLQDSIKAPLRHLLSEFFRGGLGIPEPPRDWAGPSLEAFANIVFQYLSLTTGSCPEKCWSVLQLAGMGKEKMQSRHQFLLSKLHRCTKSNLVFSELLILSFTSMKPDISLSQQHLFFSSPSGLGFCLWNQKKKR